MEMEAVAERERLKTYFYEWHPYLDLMFFIGILTSFVFGIGFIILAVWLIARIMVLLMSTSGDEVLYDRILDQDIAFLKRRSVDHMGVIEEEFSLIEPLEGIGLATDDNVKLFKVISEKKDLLARIGDFFRFIFHRIAAIFRALTGRPDFISKCVVFEGNDNRIRGSLVTYTHMVFMENQIVSYTCIYDIALGVILEEYVREVFYRDVDAVTYGDETLHYFNKKFRLVKDKLTQVSLAVASGKHIVASMQGKTEMLENQVMAMKSLIRSKKEELA